MVLLEDSELFRKLPPEELRVLHLIAAELVVPPGKEIFREGDHGDAIYLVKEGLVEISALVGRDVRQVLSRIPPGDVFGEMAVLDDKPRSACARAAEPTVIYRIPRAEILVLIERSPALALRLLREISERLREFDQHYLREVLQAERLAVVGRFARSIVHDLKNPLNIIGLAVEMAWRPQAKPESRQYAQETILKQIDLINELVGEILAFTQGAPAELPVAPMEYDDFLGSVLTELRAEAALRSVTILADEPLPPARLRLNPKRLRRVFFNLLHNSIEAMEKGGTVQVRVRVEPAEVVTEFADNGPGIPPEIAGTLFEAFTTHGKQTGTGLGLSICKRILEDHRGWITGRNAAKGGALFAFGLPLVKD